jgi:hypothetical protein
MPSVSPHRPASALQPGGKAAGVLAKPRNEVEVILGGAKQSPHAG